MPTAYFDLDRTVLACNSATLWVKSELRGGFIGWGTALRAATWIARYEVGMAKMEEAVLAAIASLEGEEEQTIRRRTEDFWHREVKDRVRPGARQALARHRDAGDRLVLLTSSSLYLSELAAEELGLDGILCNRFEVRDGRFTGRADGALCFGPGKLLHARQDAAAHGHDLGDSSFYTDSRSDLPVLQAVGRPVVVNPDPRLRRHARRVDWPVVDWGEPLVG